jgi:hypothetical protein
MRLLMWRGLVHVCFRQALCVLLSPRSSFASSAAGLACASLSAHCTVLAVSGIGLVVNRFPRGGAPTVGGLYDRTLVSVPSTAGDWRPDSAPDALLVNLGTVSTRGDAAVALQVAHGTGVAHAVDSRDPASLVTCLGFVFPMQPRTTLTMTCPVLPRATPSPWRTSSSCTASLQGTGSHRGRQPLGWWCCGVAP